MEDSKMKAEDMAFWVKSDAYCSDPKLGNLLGAYLCKALPPEKRERFEHHLDECVACWTDVTNWENMGLAAKHKQVSSSKSSEQSKITH